MSFTRQQSKRAEYQYQKANQRGKQGKFQSPHASNSNGRPSQLQTSPPTSQSSSGNQQPGSPLHSPGLGKSIESSPQEYDDTAKHMHDRMLFLLANMVGMTVQITVKNGTKYEGVFHGAIAEGELGTVLKLSRKLGGNVEGKSNPNPLIMSQIVHAKDLMEINVVGVDFTTVEKTYGERDTFKTDTDISGRAEIKERELHRWNPDDHNNETFGNLEESSSGLESNGNGSWDQFAVNEKLFGVRTDFDEEIYTTKLDRSAPDFKDREKKAIEKANEIQRSAITNVHVSEERGITVDDSGLDEEDKYSAVVRNPTKYMPPALRKQQQQQQQQQQQTPPTPPSQPAQPGQQTPPAPVTTTPTPTPPSKPSSKEPIKELKSVVEPKLATASQPTTTAVGKPVTPSSISHLPNIRPDSAALLNKNAVGSAVDGKDSAKKSLDVPPKRMEDMYLTFRQFATMEKEKLQQKKQALAKKEKSDRLAELKKFHENFVLNVPVPPDLIPLLSKGKKGSPTQTEGEKIGEKLKDAATATSSGPPTASSASSAESAKRPTPEKKAEDKAAPTPVQAQEASITPQKLTSTKEPAETATTPKPIPGSPQIEKPSSNATFKFNVNVKEFKPNPSAPAFTPGGQAQKTPAAEMSPFFGGRTLKKGPLSVSEVLASPFSKNKHIPGAIPPFWPFGTRPYRTQFALTIPYDEDMYAPGGVAPGYPYVYPMQPPYRYAQMPQFGMPPMPMQQGAPIPYMNPGFAQPGFQQFVQNMPFTTAPMQHAQPPPAVYSPQISSQVIPPHQYGSQGFPSPQRAPMVALSMHQMYSYQPPHGHGSPMMRYPPELMPPNMMMQQRPMMPIDPNMMHHYAPPEQPIVEIPSEPTSMQ